MFEEPQEFGEECVHECQVAEHIQGKVAVSSWSVPREEAPARSDQVGPHGLWLDMEEEPLEKDVGQAHITADTVQPRLEAPVNMEIQESEPVVDSGGKDTEPQGIQQDM